MGERQNQRLMERATTVLGAEETPLMVAPGQEGMNANYMIFGGLLGVIPMLIIVLAVMRGRVLVLTANGLVILDTGLGTKPKGVLARLPRGPQTIVLGKKPRVLPFHRVTVGDHTVWVPRIARPRVEAMITAMSASPMGMADTA